MPLPIFGALTSLTGGGGLGVSGAGPSESGESQSSLSAPTLYNAAFNVGSGSLSSDAGQSVPTSQGASGTGALNSQTIIILGGILAAAVLGSAFIGSKSRR